MSFSPPVIGLMPAAGRATRLAPLPVSKELFPIGFQTLATKGLRPKVICQYLLERMRYAQITEAFVILGANKWDIPAYLGDGRLLGMHLAYLTVHVPFGVPFSLDQAYPFVRNAVVALGFPDLLFTPDRAYETLLQHLHRTGADVVLGLFPTDQPQQVGVVEFDAQGVVSGLYEKSSLTHLRYMWAIAVWQPTFTQFLHDTVQDHLHRLIADDIPQLMATLPDYTELPIGDVIQAAIAAGLRVEAHPFEEGHYLDIGIPENLAKAVSLYGSPS